MPMLWRCASNNEWPSVQGNALAAFQRLAKFGHAAIDCQPAVANPLFNPATGTVSGGGQNLLNTISQDRLYQPALADAS
jgi:hypothetical protein